MIDLVVVVEYIGGVFDEFVVKIGVGVFFFCKGENFLVFGYSVYDVFIVYFV